MLGLTLIADADGVRALIMPNLKAYDAVLAEGLRDEARREQAEFVVRALMRALKVLGKEVRGSAAGENGVPEGEALKERLAEVVGEVLAERVVRAGDEGVARAVLDEEGVA